MDFSKLKKKTNEVKQSLKPREKTIKPKPGSNRYVLMPGWRPGEEEVLGHAFGAHYVKDASEATLAYVPCRSASHGEHCEVCASIASAIKSAPDDGVIGVLKQSVSKTNYIVNVLELDGEDPNTPKMLELSKTTYEAVLGMVEEWMEQLFDPSEPMVFTITRNGKGLDTKYVVGNTPKKHKLPAGVLAALPNIDDHVRAAPEEEVRKALMAFNGVAAPLVKGIAGALPASRDVPKTPALTGSLKGGTVLEAPVADEPAIDDELSALLNE